MARTQTRRTVSLNRAIFELAKKRAAKEETALSHYTEAALRQYMGLAPAEVPGTAWVNALLRTRGQEYGVNLDLYLTATSKGNAEEQAKTIAQETGVVRCWVLDAWKEED